MKIFTTFLTTSVAAMSLCSCVALKKMPEYPPVSVEVMENMVPQNGKLPVKLSFNIPEEYANLNTGIQICPSINHLDGSRTEELPRMVVEGAIHQRFNERMGEYKRQYNDSITMRARYDKKKNVYVYYAEVPYQDWFANSNLSVKLIGDAYTRQIPLDEILVGNGVKDFSPYIAKEPIQKYFFWAGPSKEELIKSGADETQISEVSFPISFADIKSKKEHKELNEYLNVLFTHPEIKYYTINAVVANSPEGSIEYNTELAEERKAAVTDYLTSLKLDPSRCNYTLVSEDWDGVTKELDNLDLNHANEIREAILTIDDANERESYIRSNFRSDWNKISRDVFPNLRRADINIIAYYKGKDGFVKSKDGFTFQQSPLVDAYKLHNQMLDAVKDKDYKLAAEYADKIGNQNLPETVLANKGSVYLMNGRYDDARLLLERVESINEARYNLGLAYLMLERFSDAEKAFNGHYDLNVAITKMYLGKYKEAAEILRMLPASAERDALAQIAEKEIK